MFFKTMKSIENNFDDPQVNELLTKHFIELRSVSPEGSSHVLDIPGLKDPSIKFWSLWENNELIGCGALKLFDELVIEIHMSNIHSREDFRHKSMISGVSSGIIIGFGDQSYYLAVNAAINKISGVKNYG